MGNKDDIVVEELLQQAICMELKSLRTMAREGAFPVDYYGAPTVNNGDRCLRSHRRIRERAFCELM